MDLIHRAKVVSTKAMLDQILKNIASMGMKTDEVTAKAIKEAFEERLPGYERILSKQKYLAGDDLTLVDLFHLPHGQLVVDVRQNRSSLCLF